MSCLELVEALFEALPQLILQTFIIIMDGDTDAVVLGLVSISYMCTAVVVSCLLGGFWLVCV